MALMAGNLYQALIQAGASDESARKAAEEVAGWDNRIASIDNKVTRLTWMVGGIGALNTVLLGGVLKLVLH